MRTDVARKVSSAVAVRWTPALATRVARRIEGRLAARRRRRRRAVVTLFLLGLASVGYAFTHRWSRPARAPVAVGPGARGFAPPPPAAPAPPTAAPAAPASAPVSAVPARRKLPARAVTLAAHRAAAPETVEALFAAADAARLAGRPGDAVAPLTAILTRHADDPRAAIAAYQLGRVWSIDLHDPGRAAAAFTRAHDLDPRGPLAADAAAHAAEARRAAGGATP